MDENNLCKCGCGQKTWISTVSNKKYGWNKGKPVEYIRGHWSRTSKALKTRKISGLRGENHPMWKGGRVDHRGYVLVTFPGHHRCKSGCNYVLEHIIIAEQKINRRLEPDEIIHHLNGIKNDNRPENLIVIKKNNHDTHTVNKLMQERIRFLEGLVNKNG